MRTVRLTVAFDGTRYEGWQSQRRGKTLQETIERTLERLFGKRTDLISSSRTDSGVHALGLVAHFKTSSALSDSTIRKALNFHLPGDILVLSARTAPDGFHARYSAVSKTYRYDLWNSATRPLREAPYAWWYPHRLDLPSMRQAARHLTGEHDFAAFRDKGEEDKSTVRRIHRITLKRHGKLLRIEITGSGFLRHMVRIIVGTLIEVGRGKMTPSRVAAILQSRDRSLAGPTAKPHGLTLVSVRYR